MDENLTYKIILLITLFLVLFLVYEIVEEINDARTKEGFNPEKIAKKIGNDIMSPIKKGIEGTIGKIAGTVTKAIGSVGKALESIETIGKAIANVGVQIGGFIVRVGKMFENFFKMIFKGIIQPLLGFFVAIGNVFNQLIKILLLIVDKIIELPKCTPVFIADGMKGSFRAVYKLIIPSWIRDIISLIWLYVITYPLWVMYKIIVVPLDFILNAIFGFSIEKTFYDLSKNKCYNFNAHKEVASMGKGFTSAATNFTKNFGQMDVSKLW